MFYKKKKNYSKNKLQRRFPEIDLTFTQIDLTLTVNLN